jgi:hypothetical protein
MRSARVASGLATTGDAMIAFSSPLSVRTGSPTQYSFDDWESSDPMPQFNDDVTGFPLTSPHGKLFEIPVQIPELPVHVPHHSAFGEPSSVVVPIPPLVAQHVLEIDKIVSVSLPDSLPNGRDGKMLNENRLSNQTDDTLVNGNFLTNGHRDLSVLNVGSPSQLRRRSKRNVKFSDVAAPPAEPKRKSVNQRRLYEPIVEPSQLTLLSVCDGGLFRSNTC